MSDERRFIRERGDDYLDSVWIYNRTELSTSKPKTDWNRDRKRRDFIPGAGMLDPKLEEDMDGSNRRIPIDENGGEDGEAVTV